MIEAKKRKKTAPERGQQSFSLMMKRHNDEKTDSNRLFYVPHKST